MSGPVAGFLLLAMLVCAVLVAYHAFDDSP